MIKGILLVATTYFYFLIYAQFAFLEIAKATLGENSISSIMAVMGISGIIFSLISIKLIKLYESKAIMLTGYLICGLTGIFSYFNQSYVELLFNSFLIGTGLSLLTVSLASSISIFFKQDKIGIGCGLGTGLAYFTCNIPHIFTSQPKTHGLYVAFTSLVSLLFLLRSKFESTKESTSIKINIKLYKYILVFLALVWFDSAAFYVIQMAGELKSATWHGDNQLWLNAIVHFVMAVVAGYLLDKNKISLILLLAFSYLTIGVLFVQDFTAFKSLSAIFYCSGVSLYSTALVAFPCKFNFTPSKFNNIAVAGLLYAISGWFGSAMGIGMAQDLKYVPHTFIAISACIVFSLFYKKNDV